MTNPNIDPSVLNPVSETYLCCCIEAMKKMPDKSFDLAIVDPPYGLDLANMSMGIGNSKKASKAKNRKWASKNWDKETPNCGYFLELFRVSKNQIIWGGNYFDLPPCKNYVIWDKEIPNGLSFADCEMAWTSFDNAPKMFRYSAYLDKKSKIHPTQKPIKLYEWLLNNYAKKGDKILDTHLGSQSSRIAAYKLGFAFTGFEIDPEYFEQGNERFEKAISLPLFDTPKPVIIQNSIF
jgi:site-specific DNA-methyltransferase (adenine-specific)